MKKCRVLLITCLFLILPVTSFANPPHKCFKISVSDGDVGDIFPSGRPVTVGNYTGITFWHWKYISGMCKGELMNSANGVDFQECFDLTAKGNTELLNGSDTQDLILGVSQFYRIEFRMGSTDCFGEFVLCANDPR